MCNFCDERGKTWEGSDPKCAFEAEIFNSDNWNCATMNKLRDLAVDCKAYADDQSCAIIPIPDDYEFVILSWYKSRGRTEGAWIVSEEEIKPLTIDIAENIINTASNSGYKRN